MNNLELEILTQKQSKNTRFIEAYVKMQYEDNDGDEIISYKNYFIEYLSLYNNNSNKINPILLQAFINRNMKSQYLFTAEHVVIQDGIIILFYDFESKEKSIFQSFNNIKNWIKSIIKGIAYLHSRRILHGNISLSSIFYNNDEAKIGNFSSSCIILGNDNQKFMEKMYEPEYRPQEVWNNNEWGLSADIWALGCTIYEILYRKKIFQKCNSDIEYLNQIYQWNNSTFPNLSDDWNNDIYFEINRLIISMLNVNPNNRPTIFDILKDPFFEGVSTFSTSPYSLCYYNMLQNCTNITQRNYKLEDFRLLDVKDRILSYLNFLCKNDDLNLLIMCMYEEKCQTSSIDRELLNVIIIISYIITYRYIPSFFTITRDNAERILLYTVDCDFNYVNFTKFFGVSNLNY